MSYGRCIDIAYWGGEWFEYDTWDWISGDVDARPMKVQI